MRNWRKCSHVSEPCRLEWRPSRWQQAGLLLLTLLVPPAIILSDIDGVAAMLLVVAAMGWGLWTLRRERGRRPLRIVIPAGEAPAMVDGVAVREIEVQWRGPLATLVWREAGDRRRWLLFWPDTLAPAQRRELRLAIDARRVSRARPQVAP
ncbi:hypothetical protein OK348_04155 [Flavobacterium sp. MXW15]|uniref:Toxin CptA n=1 Tax=Xanthomonas chitinilytica TaxID=2989819 RepID=A0ABT3JZC3_9XANT|nr:hypothetical protein [Xanthomonas sp. H13-6]MCW4453982.1 hypothetical protein [Flavobacterium sp. MXW15]MCW4473850.1 hypothetical protein [Xanthomonas sp. H13-6]